MEDALVRFHVAGTKFEVDEQKAKVLETELRLFMTEEDANNSKRVVEKFKKYKTTCTTKLQEMRQQLEDLQEENSELKKHQQVSDATSKAEEKLMKEKKELEKKIEKLQNTISDLQSVKVVEETSRKRSVQFEDKSKEKEEEKENIPEKSPAKSHTQQPPKKKRRLLAPNEPTKTLFGNKNLFSTFLKSVKGSGFSVPKLKNSV